MEQIDEQLAEDLTAKLGRLAERHRQVEQLLSDPEVIEDTTRLTRLAREHGALSKLVEKHEQLLEVRERLQDARETLDLYPDDEELTTLAQEELEEAGREQQRLLEEVIDLLVSDEAEANRNVIVEIRPGTGGDEAALFASDLYGMYTRYAERQGWEVELINASDTDLGGVREVICSVSGTGVWRKLRYESGGHRVQRVPETESQGRIHTSLATVAVLPEAEEVEVEIKPDELDISFVRSSGPGGQHVNKTSSCVRIVHEPTGITVRCQDEKSQSANRKKAMKVLRARLYEKYQQEQQEERDELRRSQVGTGDRNARIRTYNFPQDRVTDHRIGLDVFGVENFLMGDCDRMFDALADYDKQERIKAFIEGSKRSAPTGS
ncbi:MAG: peptide chain release factor 1 [Candidatus Brocadiia bacterium]